MTDVVTGKELANYKVTGPIDIKDGQGQTQGQYAIGVVYTFEKELGDLYVEQGLAVESEAESGTRPVEGEVPTEEEANRVAPVSEETPAETPVVEDNTEVPTQKEEDANLGVPTEKTVKILEEVEVLGETKNPGEVITVEAGIADALIASNSATEDLS